MTRPFHDRSEAFDLVGFARGRASGQASVRTFSKRARFARALKAGGLWWLAALGAVFIPVAHFVLVPSGFVCGIIVFLRRLGRVEETTAITGTCPDCLVPQTFDPGGPWRLPRTVSCPACGRGLKAVARPASSAPGC